MPRAARRIRSARSGGRDERGAGLIATWAAFVVFLTFLLFAIQVLFHLYATSVVSGVGFDAARKVAGARGGQEAEVGAEQDARRALGHYGAGAVFDWTGTDDDVVVLRIRARNPGFVPATLGRVAGFAEVDRTFRVRVERFR